MDERTRVERITQRLKNHKIIAPLIVVAMVITPTIDQIGAYKTQFPKIQILTVEQILDGEQVKIPMTTQGVFKTAGKHIQESTQQPLL